MSKCCLVSSCLDFSFPQPGEARQCGGPRYQRIATNSVHMESLPLDTRLVDVSVAVVVAFFVCWAPFHAQRVIGASYGVDERPTPAVHTIYLVLTYLSGILYYVSATINPILYHIMSLKFRQAFKVTYEFQLISAHFVHVACPPSSIGISLLTAFV